MIDDQSRLVVDEQPSGERLPRFGVASHPIWEMLTKIATPAAIAISAASYLSGYVYRYFLYGAFGFTPGLIEMSVQDTISVGYGPLAASLIFIAILVVLLRIITGMVARFLYRFVITTTEARRAIRQKAQSAIRPLIVWNVANSIAMLMMLAIGAGAVGGASDAMKIQSRLNDRCRRDCYLIRSTRGQFRGIIIGQSKEVTLAASRSAAYLLQNSSLQSLSPVGRVRKWHRAL